MTTKEFLTENRQEVINYYNDKVKCYYDVTLSAFMIDLLNNFRKVTLGDEFKKFDLFANLDEAKSRLGLMSQNKFEYADDKVTNTLRNKYKGTAYMALV